MEFMMDNGSKGEGIYETPKMSDVEKKANAGVWKSMIGEKAKRSEDKSPNGSQEKRRKK